MRRNIKRMNGIKSEYRPGTMPHMNTPLSPFQHLGLPACAVNQHGRIIYWNQYAADFLGIPAANALDAEWHSVVHTVGSAACCALCQTRHSLRNLEPVSPMDMCLSAGGRYCHVTLVPLPVRDGHEEIIGFLVMERSSPESVQAQPMPMRTRTRRLDDERIIDELTARERQILDCVIEGMDARGIANSMGISHATARNYVQRILSKLGAHNKAEAVSVALTYNLLAS
jgi:DNA-binding CsgD family transcriptional regulator